MKAVGRRAVGIGAAAVGALALSAAPAFATNVHLDTSEGEATSLHVFDNNDNADVVSVSLSGTTLNVVDTGPGGIVPDNATCTAVNAALVTCPFDPPDNPPPAGPFLPVDSVDFDAADGADSITVTAPIRVFADGGDGPDTLNGTPLQDGLNGGNGIDQLNGFAEQDEIEGGFGNDAIDAGEGDDFMTDGGFNAVDGGTDVLNGGPGTDGVSYNRDLPLALSLDDVANDGFPGEGDNLIDVESVGGGDADDVILGNDEPNEMFGSDGNDTIRTLGGSDFVEGDDGDDVLDGGADRDQFFCDEGFDIAVLSGEDVLGVDCESTGATTDVDTATVDGKGAVKIPVSCGSAEPAKCTGKVVLELNGKSIGKGKFKAAVGKTKKAKVKLSKKGRKSLSRSGGSALVTARVETKLGGATSVNEDSLLLKQKGKGKK